jgi:hypothetical protein
LVVRERDVLMERSVSMTVAPFTTAPLASVTVPTMVPEDVD